MDFKMINLAINSIISSDSKIISKFANITAAINQYSENINWVGFYFLDKTSKNLYLGPFQGKIACTDINIEKGVCGKSAKYKTTILVDDVHQFQGHIACDSNSQSEIVIPLFYKGEVVGVLDIDSPIKSRFSQDEKIQLENLVKKIEENLDLSAIYFQ